MISRNHKGFILISLLIILMIGAIIFLYHQERQPDLPEEQQETQRPRYPEPRHKIEGFRYDGSVEGRRTLSIKADSFAVEKKKVAFFRFGLMNVARLKNAVVDVYGQRPPGLTSSPALTFQDLFPSRTLAGFPVKSVSSVVMEPVLVKLRDETSVVTQVSADHGTIRIGKGDFLFRGNVRAVSGSRTLTTEQLSLLPESALLRADDSFVMKTSEKWYAGQGVTTDLLLVPR